MGLEGVHDLREHQASAIAHALGNKHIFLSLATGAGTSSMFSAASSPVRAASTCSGYFDRLSRVAEFNIQQMGFSYRRINLNLVKMLQACACQ